MKRSSAILASLVELGILTFGLVASVQAQGVVISQPVRHGSPGMLPIKPPVPILLPPQSLPPGPRPLPPILLPGPITSCTPPPSGLVGWWKGDGSALDSAGGNNGVVQNITYTSGVVGQAFACDPDNYGGAYAGIQIPDSPAYALTNALTIEGWVRPRGNGYNIFWRGDNRPGMDPYFLGMWGNNNIKFLICDQDGNTVTVGTTLNYNQWTHVAATLDGSTGTMSIYTNGVLADQTVTAIRPFGDLIPEDSPGVGIGNVNDGGNNFPFIGDIDEISLYNRALTAGEIQSVCHAGSAGKCPISPPACVSPPLGLVSWWRGEGNALDAVGTNNGELVGDVSFAPGKVGMGFSLNGSNSFIRIPNSPSLGLTNALTVELWYETTGTGQEYGVFNKRNTESGPVNYGIVVAPESRIAVYFNDPDVIDSDEVGTFEVSNYLPAPASGAFHHLAVTFQQTPTNTVVVKTFLDGQVVRTRIFGASLVRALCTAPVTIGLTVEYPDFNYFKGIIDEVSLYNRALADSEIQAIYNAGSAGKCPVAPPVCAPPPSGLVSWWPAEGNANDIVSTNNGVATDIAFTPGEVGQAFSFNGTSSYLTAPASPNLDVGQGDGFTVETWINPANLNLQTVFEWNTGIPSGNVDAPVGVHMEISGGGPGSLSANIVDTDITFHPIVSATNVMTTGSWQHVALTYDKTTGLAVLYRNGVVVASQNLGSFMPQTSFKFNLGYRAVGTAAPMYFQGSLDEASLYSRALSASEIASLYHAGSAGKCPVAPPACTPPPSGLVGWWPAEGNANDSVSGNNGVVQNISYTSGEVGQAFACDPNSFPYGTYTGVQIPDAPAYALTRSLTIEGWVRPRGDGYAIFWRGDNRPGMDPYVLSMQANNTLHFGICDADGNTAFVETTLNYFQWTHVSAILDDSSGTMSIYTNGVLAAQTVTAVRPFGDLIPEDSPGVGIGNVNDGGNNFPFTGDIDEISLYNRALSPGEIQSLYHAGSAGKCVGPFPPGITVSPVNQTTAEGSNVVLSVTAGGTGPFNYQWTFNGTNLLGATNATLTLTNLHPYQSGNYAVAITTPYGTLTSSGAVVTVLARDILIYRYSGVGRFATAGQAFTYVYSGQLFFMPDCTNGTFVGWGTIKGKKQYWVNALADYLWITIPVATNQCFTVLGQAGQGMDTNGCPHIWSYLHKGQNTRLTIGSQKYFSFPAKLSCDATHVYPEAQTGKPVLNESSSIYTFVPQSTQTANNTGQTMTDLVNALTRSLAAQGYQKQ